MEFSAVCWQRVIVLARGEESPALKRSAIGTSDPSLSSVSLTLMVRLHKMESAHLNCYNENMFHGDSRRDQNASILLLRWIEYCFKELPVSSSRSSSRKLRV